MYKESLRFAITTIGSMAFVITVASAWTAPSQTPPNGNVSAPVNVGTGDQTKYGNFYVGSGKNIAAGGYVMAPQLCIGADCRSTWPTGGSSYTAGNGITILGNTISLNTTNISSCTNSVTSKIYWNGSALVCGTDATGGGGITALSAGPGITLSPNPITTTGTISADTNVVQRRITGTCGAGSGIRTVNADGSVVCETEDVESAGDNLGNQIADSTSGLNMTNTTIFNLKNPSGAQDAATKAYVDSKVIIPTISLTACHDVTVNGMGIALCPANEVQTGRNHVGGFDTVKCCKITVN